MFIKIKKESGITIEGSPGTNLQTTFLKSRSGDLCRILRERHCPHLQFQLVHPDAIQFRGYG
jgi:hypothetical protein